MRSVLIIITFMICTSAFSTLNIEWTYDLELSNTHSVAEIEHLENDNLAIFLKGGFHSTTNGFFDFNGETVPITRTEWIGSKIVFLSENGELIGVVDHTLSLFNGNLVEIHSKKHIGWIGGVMPADVRLYSINSNNEIIEEVVSASNILPYRPKRFHDATYFIEGSTLFKLSESSSEVIISSQTSSGFNQDNFVLNWDSSSGTEYQIQSSTDLTNWVNVGSAIVGTGETMTWANHVTNSQAFYRVVED